MDLTEIRDTWRKNGRQRSTAYLSSNDLRPTIASLVVAPRSGARLLVAISENYAEALLRKRMGDFADFFLSREAGNHCYAHCDCDRPVTYHPFEVYGNRIGYATKQETTEVMCGWQGQTLAQLNFADYVDEPLGVWNPITHQAEELAGAVFGHDGHLMVTLSDETVGSLLQAFYEPFHRALGLDPLQS
jgi:hypothetical protein